MPDGRSHGNRPNRKSDRNARLCALYETGVGIRGLAREFGITAERARQILHDCGVVVRPMSVRKSLASS